MARLTKPSRSKAAATTAEKEARRMAAEIVMIADDAAGDYVVKKAPKSSPGHAAEKVLDRSAIARAKLRIDVRMWLMVRLAPHIYGVPVAKSGSRPQAPQPFQLDIDLDPDPDA